MDPKLHALKQREEAEAQTRLISALNDKVAELAEGQDQLIHKLGSFEKLLREAIVASGSKSKGS